MVKTANMKTVLTKSNKKGTSKLTGPNKVSSQSTVNAHWCAPINRVAPAKKIKRVSNSAGIAKLKKAINIIIFI
jgi:hypothetical protein